MNEVAVQKAVILIMESFPKKNSGNVLQRALQLLGDDREHLDKISRLVKTSPSAYGIERTHAYWNIVFSILSKEQVLPFYLKQFPKEITQAQYQAMQQYVQKIFDLSEEDTEKALAKFTIRFSITHTQQTAVSSFVHAY